MSKAPTLFLKGSAAFDGIPVFDDITLEVAACKWTCLLGPSGVGKSTILKLFAGIGDAVSFDGEVRTSDGPIAGQVALMSQSDLLMPWLTVADNVMLGARLRGEVPDRQRAAQVLEQVGLADKEMSKPHELSGGQRQRVALARTLMEDRLVVLLDEPFSALDARTRAQMHELTADVLDSRTILLVTHDPAEATRLGDVIMIMTENGIENVAPPTGSVPRRLDDVKVLQAQVRLLSQLRDSA